MNANASITKRLARISGEMHGRIYALCAQQNFPAQDSELEAEMAQSYFADHDHWQHCHAQYVCNPASALLEHWSFRALHCALAQ